MYHFVAQQDPVELQLSNKVKIPGHIRQYLTNFQTDAIRFLFPAFDKHKFCILNDESGLGKSASISVLLGAVVINKKCLIVVNDDDLVTGWQFHLSVLTNLSVMVIKDEKDSTDNNYNVYIAKWNTLRSINVLSNYNFDYVIVDNRGRMLNNNFCTSMLIKNYERKVDIVISSVDITSDIKLLFNTLRLGGCLEPKYERYKSFEEHFKLPDLMELAIKKINLDEYYVKREILSNYCKEFRLRRYRYQFQDELPLVKPQRHNISLELWRTASNVNDTQSSSETVHSVVLPLEKLAQKDTTLKSPNKLSLTAPTVLNNLLLNINMENIDLCEDESECMSPLLLLSDSETEAEPAERTIEDINVDKNDQDDKIEVVDLSSEEIFVVEVESENFSTKSTENKKKKNVSKTLKKTKCHNNITKEKSKLEKSTKRKEKFEEDNGNSTATTRVNDASSENQIKTRRSKTVERKDSSPTKTQSVVKRTPGKRKNTTAIDDTKEKKSTCTSEVKLVKNTKHLAVTIAAPNPSPANARNASSKKLECNKSKSTSPKPTKVQSSKKNDLRKNNSSNVEWKDTRRMARLTRLAMHNLKNKYMLNNLELEIDKKSKNKKKKPQTKAVMNASSEAKYSYRKKTKEDNAITDAKDSKENSTKKKVGPKNSKLKENKCKSNDKNVSSQLPVLSYVSEYEDIQCGQRLSFNTSNTINQCLRSEFLVPSTPPTHATPLVYIPSTSFFADSDVILVQSERKSNHNKNQDIIVLSSSQDSTKSNQSRRTRALKQKKPIKTSDTKQSANPKTFGDFFDKQTERNTTKSPDLFSNCSDIPITCTQIPNNTTFDGFKIFGSEVKQFQQQNALLDKQKSLQTRSCLDILEKIFDPRLKKINTNASIGSKNSKNNNTPILPTHPIEAIVNSQKKEHKSKRLEKTKKNLRMTMQPKHVRNEIDEDIFEITTNEAFGSTMRINANGDISPVQAKATQTANNHNKITNYLIGSTHSTPADEDTTTGSTPSKRTQLPASTARKSPKSKSTQSTKLTKWFHKNATSGNRTANGSFKPNTSNGSVNTDRLKMNTAGNDVTPPKTRTRMNGEKPKVLKETRRRRRLDLSF